MVLYAPSLRQGTRATKCWPCWVASRAELIASVETRGHAVDRIPAMQAMSKIESRAEQEHEHLQPLVENNSGGSRPTLEYQPLLD